MKLEKKERIKAMRCLACGIELYHDHDEEYDFSDDLCRECSFIVGDNIGDLPPFLSP